jgi:PIN domain nuclease of toxin-antitoxin system
LGPDGAGVTMLVLDTHAALWWTLEPTRLGHKIATRLAREDRLVIPTIVFWEVSLLVRKGRLRLELGAAEWTRKVCTIPRVVPLPLTTEIALLADTLAMHPDPTDRFIVATAMVHGAALGTKDALLRTLRFVRTVW